MMRRSFLVAAAVVATFATLVAPTPGQQGPANNLPSAAPATLPPATAAPATAPPFGVSPLPSAIVTPPPLSATATPTPQGTLLRYSGMLLSVQKGFAFFTTGDGFRIAPTCAFVDASTGKPTTIVARTRVYARATFDATSGAITELALSRTPLPNEAAYDQVARFKVAISTPAPNPDLDHPGGQHFSGRTVIISFHVQVPTSTAISDDVYVTTDLSDWNPRAIKLDRVDALHYRGTVQMSSGTIVSYRYTRGSFSSVERGPTGLEQPPRSFQVRDLDVMTRSDVVAHWSDETVGAPAPGPNNIPTPFNPNPFPWIHH